MWTVSYHGLRCHLANPAAHMGTFLGLISVMNDWLQKTAISLEPLV